MLPMSADHPHNTRLRARSAEGRLSSTVGSRSPELADADRISPEVSKSSELPVRQRLSERRNKRQKDRRLTARNTPPSGAAEEQSPDDIAQADPHVAPVPVHVAADPSPLVNGLTPQTPEFQSPQ